MKIKHFIKNKAAVTVQMTDKQVQKYGQDIKLK